MLLCRVCIEKNYVWSWLYDDSTKWLTMFTVCYGINHGKLHKYTFFSVLTWVHFLIRNYIDTEPFFKKIYRWSKPIEKFSYWKWTMIDKGFFLNFLAHAKQSLFSITTATSPISYHQPSHWVKFITSEASIILKQKSETCRFLKLFLLSEDIAFQKTQSAQASLRNFSQHLSYYFYF